MKKRGKKIVREYVNIGERRCIWLAGQNICIKERQERLQLGWTDNFQIEIERISK
jgi:hypothetical protein